MSSFRLILASLLHHWRMNLAVGCGAAAGTAVLTGALLVGDSMRGSLRGLTLQRLGRVDEALVTERFFRAELADELAAQPEFKDHFATALPLIMLRASLQWQHQADGLEPSEPRPPVRAGGVNLLACDERFWKLWPGDPQTQPGAGQVVLNRPLAEKLGVSEGQRVVLNLPRMGNIPADSLLGRKDGTVQRIPLSVGRIIPAEGAGRFSLQPNQRLPLNAYVSMGLRKRLRLPGGANVILVAGKSATEVPPPESKEVQGLLRPRLDDYGIRVEKTPRGYFNITSDRMLLEPDAQREITEALADEEVQPALTYLANTIACGTHEIPYSTVTAVDFTDKPPLGPFLTPDGKPIGRPGRDRIVLNAWAAEDLGARPGDTIRLTYFEPESTHGATIEKTVSLELAAIVQLAGAAADPAFTPEVPGVTDEESINDWDPPFHPFHRERVRSPGKDGDYWDRYRATPKVFVSLGAGRELWGSRFGQTTSLRVAPAVGMTVESLKEELVLDPAAMGFVFAPVKRQGLAAAVGTTPFDVLFLMFSFFVIAAAVMLVALLFRLGIDGRGQQLGILLAVGLNRRQVARLLAAEGLAVTAVAGLVGVAGGIGYAAVMLAGLRSWWLEAVVTPFLHLHVTPMSLAIGYFSGVVIALGTIVWSVRRAGRIAPRRLLAGRIGEEGLSGARTRRRTEWLAWGLLVAAAVFGLMAARSRQEIQAGAFFGVGAVVLVAVLALIWNRLRAGATGPAVSEGPGNLLRMALRNAARNPTRSTLSIGLVAAVCFLIAAVSAFRLDPANRLPTLDSGDGGFALVARSDLPIYHELNTSEGRRQLGFPPDDDDAELLGNAVTCALRVNSGDDASCLNLYQPRQPRILGVPDAMIRRGGFDWADWKDRGKRKAEGGRGKAEGGRRKAEGGRGKDDNPWLLLEQDLGTDQDGAARVPVVLEKNTAMYSLHLWKGVGETYEVTDGRGQTVRLEVVGLLNNGIFQGDLLIGEKAFLRHFPQQSGYRLFLIQTKPGETAAVERTLERILGDYGFAAETTGDRLARFLAVQNTYLSTFQSLGGLGLLLGTFGLGAVQMRNVLERRRELALLRAVGFRRGSLGWMVMLENGVLLIAGLGAGLIAALVAVLPHLLGGEATIPFGPLGTTLVLVLVIGLAAGFAAVRATLSAPLLAALRED